MADEKTTQSPAPTPAAAREQQAERHASHGRVGKKYVVLHDGISGAKGVRYGRGKVVTQAEAGDVARLLGLGAIRTADTHELDEDVVTIVEPTIAGNSSYEQMLAAKEKENVELRGLLTEARAEIARLQQVQAKSDELKK